jgi:type I restriction enzyme, S subunit
MNIKNGWEIKTIGDVCKVIAGQSPEGKFYNNNGSGMPFYQGKKEYGEKYIGEPTTWTTKITKEAEANDVLMSVRAPVGPINFATQKICIGRGLAAIRPTKLIDKEFLYSFLLKHESEIVGNTGAVFNSINKAQIEAIEIPLPPLPEQKRIVAILDETFAVIAKAKANAEQNLKNAKELFESYLQGVFENKGEGWEEKTLGEIADVEYGYTDKSTEEGDYRYIRITDIDKNGELILDDKKYIKHSKEAEGFLIQDNDLLMARTGATFAKVLLYNGDEPSVFASYLISIKFKEKFENALYWYFTKTKYYWEQANSLQSGAAQPHFNGAAVKQVIFSYPKSIKEQKALIKKFETLSIETKKLEAIYNQKISDLEELKKSVLQKAFNGELKTEKKNTHEKATSL